MLKNEMSNRSCLFFPGCSKDNRVSFNKKVMANFKKEMAKFSGKKGKFEMFVEIVQVKNINKSSFQF
jgi:hypothetical protein